MTQQINLYQAGFLRRNPLLEPGALLGYALALVLVLGLGAAGFARSQRVQLQSEAASIEAQIKAQQEQSVALAAQKAARVKDPALEAEVVRLETMVRRRSESLAVIGGGALGSTSGFSAHMRALARQSVGGLWLTGFSIANGGNDVTLRGRMLNADLLPRFLGRLGSEKSFEGRGFKSLVIDQPRSADAPAPATAAAPAAAQPAPAYLMFEIATLDAVSRGPAGAAPGAPK